VVRRHPRYVDFEPQAVTLDGLFTADELEALAIVMRAESPSTQEPCS